MIILHIVSVKNPNGNGVISAVDEYVKYESKENKVAIYNIGNSINNNIDSKSKIFSFSEFSNIKQLPSPFNKPDLIVFNEVYKIKYIDLYKECKKREIPYIIIPHGCLVKRAQNSKKIKKMFANIVLFNGFINNSLAIQYLNTDEMKNSVFKNHKYIISGNGIQVTEEKNNYVNKDFIYIGRYDYKIKGLDLIIKTIKENKKWFINNKVVVQLYGRNCGNSFETIKKMIYKNGIENIMILNNAIYNDQKRQVLLNSYAFIQVSRHEGQPMGIMEALSYGLPCIVTYGTSFGNYVNENNCGIGINFDSNELFLAIKKIYEDEKIRNQYAFNSKIIEKDYDWNIVIEKCVKKYRDLLNI